MKTERAQVAAKATVLVVGGGHAEIPLIRAAHAIGYRVITTGNRPDDLGHAHADLYVPADFSKPEEILNVAVTHDVSAIVSGCNDFAMLSTAFVCEKLGLPGHDSYETTVRIHHKDRFRELLEELQLDTPRSGVVHDPTQAVALCERIGYPVIVKPVDLTGGKGISVCDSPEQLSKAVDDALVLVFLAHVPDRGRAEIVDDIEKVLDVLERVNLKYHGGAPTGIRDALRGQAAKRIVMRIHPERTTSWDHAKLGGVY